MKRKKFTEEQIIHILRQADGGKKPEELARENGMAVGTFYAWKAKFGGIDVNEAQRLRTLEEENRRLKTLVADQALDIRALQFVVQKKDKCGRASWRGQTPAGRISVRGCLEYQSKAKHAAGMVEMKEMPVLQNRLETARQLFRRCKKRSVRIRFRKRL